MDLERGVPGHAPGGDQRLARQSSPLAEPLGQLDPREYDSLVADVEDALAPYIDDDGLAVLMESHIVVAE